MLRLTIFIFLIIGLTQCKQSSINKVLDDNGVLTEEYEVDNKTNLKNGVYKRYRNGSLVEAANYIQNKLEGARVIYNDNGHKEIEENFENGVRQGDYVVYYESGAKELVMPYVNGVLQGTAKKYYESGKIMEEVLFVNNEENGAFLEFHESGAKKWEGTYRNGENEVGLLKEYDETGKLIKKMMCDSMSICQTIWTPELGDIQPKQIMNR